ncbi:MAG: 3-deoxy-7-phosphoheptulonate synthase [Actinomycetota bacterium]|nr:3-deoxy-7-phosphoheptulonate synthase [Actinomycetota bacterium]
MIVIMKDSASNQEIDHVIEKLDELKLEVHISRGKFRTIIGIIGEEEMVSAIPLEAFPGVERVVPVLKPYRLVSREFSSDDTVIEVNGSLIGGGNFAVIAGPCSIESEEQAIETARSVKAAGATMYRGGAFKPRTSPYSFQGLGLEGLKILAEARKETGLPIVTEVMDTRDVDAVTTYSDILQIGARNMQNFQLLTEVGKQHKPVVLKRGFSNTIEEFLMAAEYVAKGGNQEIILCERGIRTFEPYTRNTLDISAIPLLKGLSHLPVIVDPSHATGRRDLVGPLSLASIAAGADGLMIEVHQDPESALCDGPQSLNPQEFTELMKEISSLVKNFSKRIGA